MKQWGLGFALVSVFVVAAQGQGGPGPVPLPKDFVARASSYVDGWAKAGRFSGSVLISIEGKTVLRKAYGYADWATRRPITPETSVPIFSISKSFTAGAVLLLQDRGLLSVEDRASKYLSDLPEGMKEVTIHQLLTHTSGASLKDQWAWYKAHYGRTLSTGPLKESVDRKAGATWEYSNAGYMMLSAVVEKVSGQPFDRFLQEAIFTPLGMSGAGVGGYWEGKKEVARGHRAFGGRLVPCDQFLSIIPGAGSVHANVDDLLKWREAIDGETLFSPASQKFFHTASAKVDGVRRYGYGWFYHTEWPMWEHTGGGASCETSVAWLPDRKMTIVVLKNSDSSAGPLFAMELAGIAYDAHPVVPRMPSLEMVDRAQGVYVGPMGTRAVLSLSDDVLSIQFGKDAAKPLEFAGGRKFQTSGFVAALQPRADGAFDLRLTLNGSRVLALRRVVSSPLSDYVGRYTEGQESTEIRQMGRWLVVPLKDKTVSNDVFPLALLPSGRDRFVLSGIGTVVQFRRDASGRVKEVRTVVQGKVTSTARRG